MENFEILHQYAFGNLSTTETIQILKNKLISESAFMSAREIALTRYTLGFVCRVLQFLRGSASEKDLCLKIRDLCWYYGSIEVPITVYETAKKAGGAFGLRFEGSKRISCDRTIPSWLQPESYVMDVYALSESESFDEISPGDSILSQNTKFHLYKNFEQKVAVHTALSLPKGKTLLVSLPTGGGKSLITQLLAACSDGLTIVIVPTVALALDQLYAATENLIDNSGIYCYRGNQSDEERQEILSSLKDHSAKLLFISPEAIIKNVALSAILEQSSIDGYLKNTVIDEAHIVPDWGVFFRPDFQVFSVLLRKWRRLSQNAIRTYLLSATLSDDVVQTLFSLFGEQNNNIQLRCDALRSEPRFYFCPTKSIEDQELKTIEAIVSLPKPMVVYVLEPDNANSLKKKMLSLGYKNITTFTGKTNDDERDRILQAWKNNEYDIIIATSAFGIGVDKPDVRTIIHSCVPENLSRFYQEVGRAGRDRLPSISLMIPYQSRYDGRGDLRRALNLVNKRVLTVPKMIPRWFGLIKDSRTVIQGDTCVLDTASTPTTVPIEEVEFAGDLNVSWNMNLLLFLHRSGYLKLLDVNYQQSTRSYLIKARILKTAELSSESKLEASLQEIRSQELDLQLAGYRSISKLVQSPRSVCWGRRFKQLFPLCKEVCHGCPAGTDDNKDDLTRFKIRTAPELSLPPEPPCRKLKRKMGDYCHLLIASKANVSDEHEIREVCRKVERFGIGAVILPSHLSSSILYNGIVLSYEEFYFSAIHTPYLFHKGLLCVFSQDNASNQALMESIMRLKPFQYRTLMLCNTEMKLSRTGRSINESLEGYCLTADRL